MKIMKRIAAMTAALLICSGTMAYMPQGSFINADINAAYAAEDTVNENVAINETNFPDENFRQYVADVFDTDGDGVLSAAEIIDVTEIHVSKKNISELTGIEYFSSLKKLICGENQIVSLNVSHNTVLEYLNCKKNHLTSLDISRNTALEWLDCYENQLTTLDTSKNTAFNTFILS